MLSSLRSGSSDRVRQSALLVQHVRQLENLKDSSIEELIRTQKGLLFVSLYSSIEFTLTNAVSDFLAVLQSSPETPSKYKVGLLTLLLNREFNAVTASSKRRMWENKLALLKRLGSNDICAIDNDVFPAESINISADHFTSVWTHLHLPGPPIPVGVNPWVINEIKDHRNAIAHGRERAATIGSRFTSVALEERHQAVEALCASTVFAFEEHIKNRTFLAAP